MSKSIRDLFVVSFVFDYCFLCTLPPVAVRFSSVRLDSVSGFRCHVYYSATAAGSIEWMPLFVACSNLTRDPARRQKHHPFASLILNKSIEFWECRDTVRGANARVFGRCSFYVYLNSRAFYIPASFFSVKFYFGVIENHRCNWTYNFTIYRKIQIS